MGMKVESGFPQQVRPSVIVEAKWCQQGELETGSGLCLKWWLRARVLVSKRASERAFQRLCHRPSIIQLMCAWG